jgi:hypothetical protein
VTFLFGFRRPGFTPRNGRDEIDTVSQSNYHGEPPAAVLEVLEPEQKVTFNA